MNRMIIATLLIYSYQLMGHGHKHGHSHDHGHDHHHDEHIELTAEVIEKEEIHTAVAGSGNLYHTIQSPAHVTLNQNEVVHVVPKVAGIVLTAHHNVGDKVKKGDVLATLESREVAESKAEYLAAMKTFQLKKRMYLREEELNEKGITADEEFYNAQAAMEEAEITMDLAEQKLLALGLDANEIDDLPETDPKLLRIYEMRSPISGTVIHRHLSRGELVDLNQEPYTIADLKSVWVEIDLYSSEFSQVEKGKKVSLHCRDGRQCEGTIAMLDPVISEETRRAKAIAILDNQSGRWAPGTFMTALIHGESISVSLAVPTHAVHKIDGKDSVFIKNDHDFEVRPVKLGRSDSESVEILAGLKKGDVFVNENSFILKAEHGKDEVEHEH